MWRRREPEGNRGVGEETTHQEKTGEVDGCHALEEESKPGKDREDKEKDGGTGEGLNSSQHDGDVPRPRQSST